MCVTVSIYIYIHINIIYIYIHKYMYICYIYRCISVVPYLMRNIPMFTDDKDLTCSHRLLLLDVQWCDQFTQPTVQNQFVEKQYCQKAGIQWHKQTFFFGGALAI